MTELIVVRRFWWEGEPDRELLVMTGKPTQPPDHNGEFYCPIQTSGSATMDELRLSSVVMYSRLLSLQMRYIEHWLSDIDAKSGGRRRWQFGDEQRLPPERALQEQPPDL